MSEITAALETLQKIVSDPFNSKGAAGCAALSIIESELDRLLELSDDLTRLLNDERLAAIDACAERDEAVAALRAITHTGVMHCPVVSGIGSPCTCGIKAKEPTYPSCQTCGAPTPGISRSKSD